MIDFGAAAGNRGDSIFNHENICCTCAVAPFRFMAGANGERNPDFHVAFRATSHH